MELRALREVSEKLFDRNDIGELVLDSSVTPKDLASAIDSATSAREMTGSSREEISRAFMEAALTVAGAGDGLDVREGTTIREFGLALGFNFDERGKP